MPPFEGLYVGTKGWMHSSGNLCSWLCDRANIQSSGQQHSTEPSHTSPTPLYFPQFIRVGQELYKTNTKVYCNLLITHRDGNGFSIPKLTGSSSFFIRAQQSSPHCQLCSESSVKTEPVHMAMSMWRQTQQERRRGWLMFIQHCILLVQQAGCLSSLLSLMRTICPTRGEASSALHLKHIDHRPHLLLFHLLLFLSLSVHISHIMRRDTEGVWHLSQKTFIFQSASTLIEHSLRGMFGILVWTEGTELHPVWTFLKC